MQKSNYWVLAGIAAGLLILSIVCGVHKTPWPPHPEILEVFVIK